MYLLFYTYHMNVVRGGAIVHDDVVLYIWLYVCIVQMYTCETLCRNADRERNTPPRRQRLRTFRKPQTCIRINTREANECWCFVVLRGRVVAVNVNTTAVAVAVRMR